MNDVVDVQTLAKIYEVFKESKVTKKNWFGTRPRSGYLAKMASAVVNYEMLEVHTEGYTTPLVLPDSAVGVINSDNKKIFRELTAAWNEINDYQKFRRDRRNGFDVDDLDARNIFWQELKERLREISFMTNHEQILIELGLVDRYLTEVTTYNNGALFPRGIDGEKTTRATIAKVQQYVTDAMISLKSKEESDPLPVLCEDLAVSIYNNLELLLQYCFIQLRGDENRLDFSSVATFVSLRDLVANSTKRIYSKPLSQLLINLANKDISKILFPSGAKQYKVSHRAERTPEVYRVRLKAMCEPNRLLLYKSTQEQEKTPYALREAEFELRYLPNAIKVNLDGKTNIVEINLAASDSGVDKPFITDDVLLTNLMVLVGILEDLMLNVLLAEDAQHLLNLIGQSGVLANFAGNAFIAAHNTILDCDIAIKLIETIHTQCKEAALSKLRDVKYTPLNRADPLDETLAKSASDTWLKNHEICQKISSSLINSLKNDVRARAVKLRDKAELGFDPKERKNLSLAMNHFSGVSALLTHKRNLQQSQRILNREDPTGIYWKITPEDYGKLKDLTFKIFVSVLVKQLPTHIKNDILTSCNSLSLTNYDLILLLTNHDFMRNADRVIDKNKHLNLRQENGTYILPRNDTVLLWVLKLFIQKNFVKSKLIETYQQKFAENITPDLIKNLPDVHVFLIGYILAQISSAKPLAQFNEIIDYLQYRAELLAEKYERLRTENIDKPGIAQAKANLDAIQNYLGLLGIAQGIPTNAICDLSHILVALNHHQIQLTVDAMIHPEMEGSDIGIELEQLVSSKLHHGKPQHTMQMYDRRQPGQLTPPVPSDPSSSTSRVLTHLDNVTYVPPLRPPASPVVKPAAAAGAPSNRLPTQDNDDDIDLDIAKFASMNNRKADLNNRKTELARLFREQGNRFSDEQLAEYEEIKKALAGGVVGESQRPIRRLQTSDSVIGRGPVESPPIAPTVSQPNLSTVPPSQSSEDLRVLPPSTPVPKTPVPKGSPSPAPISAVPKGGNSLPPAPTLFQRERSDSNIMRFNPQPAPATPPPTADGNVVTGSNNGSTNDLRRNIAMAGFTGWMKKPN